MTTLKPLLTILAVALTVAVIAALPTTPQPVTLMWEQGEAGWDTNTTVRIYTHTNVAVPMSQWTVIASATGTNAVTIQLQPGVHFFVANASNFWGVSDFSNVAWTPPLPRGDNLSIRRGN